jgi:hypothetical protein
MSGGTFSKGVKFMRANLDPNVALQANVARQALERIGIRIGRWAYDQSPERLVRRSVQDNPKLGMLLRDVRRTLVGLMSYKQRRLEDQSSQRPENGIIYLHINEGYDWFERYTMYARGYTFEKTDNPELHAKYTNMVGKSFIEVVTDRQSDDPILVVVSENLKDVTDIREGDDVITVPTNLWDLNRNDFIAMISERFKHGTLIKDYWYSEYRWQEPLHFMYDAEVDLVHEEFIPIAGMDPIIVEKMKATGVNSAGDENSLKLKKLAAALIKTRSLPNDITSDKLIEIVTHPSIIKDRTRVVSVLIAMGVDSEAAVKFAIDVHNIASKFLMVSTIKTFSTSDQIIGNMALDVSAYDRIVEIGPIANGALESYIKSAAILHSLVDPNFRMRKTRIWIEGTKMPELEHEVLGNLYDYSDSMIQIYPTAPM